ncbi:non-specific lipid-transfer protein 2 [Juglans regia]|uniref:Non-specific lipid-transfer protein 2 n=2 Tax=Juglans regia TaxID=51240 RepID=A0A2I4EB91_JUGRE|nr:non-specific lipid-transfer protein 2 [Juglans regia]
MKKVCCVLLCVVVAVAVLLSEAPLVAEAVTCNYTELSPCLAAIVSPAKPSATCCQKLREQKPCLCVYYKNPNLKQYINSPGAKKVASSCGVSLPKC